MAHDQENRAAAALTPGPEKTNYRPPPVLEDPDPTAEEHCREEFEKTLPHEE